jgi:hypothetical protein
MIVDGESIGQLLLLERIIPIPNCISLRPLRLCGKTSTVAKSHGAAHLDLHTGGASGPPSTYPRLIVLPL